jgi:hypothetical protein
MVMHAIARVRRSHVVIGAIVGSPTPWRDAWLGARMLAWALALPALKRIVPLPTLVRVMWKSGATSQRDPDREQRIARLAGWFARATNPSNAGACLQRSLLTYRFLSESHADPRLMVAFRKTDAALAGHAWIVVDGQAIGEPAGALDDFLPVVAFGAHGARVPA